MARPKRMGAYNALDELLPGPSPRPRLEPVPDPPPPRARRSRGRNALDDLLPGPGGPEGPRGGPPVGQDGPDAGDGLDWGSPRARLEPVARPGRRPAAAGRRQHLGAWNPLDDLPSRPAPPGPPAPKTPRARLTLRLPDDLVEAARDAVARLAGTPAETTLTALAERALRAELDRLAATHNHGRPFPARREGRSR
jgi:hypothetical protein